MDHLKFLLMWATNQMPSSLFLKSFLFQVIFMTVNFIALILMHFDSSNSLITTVQVIFFDTLDLRFLYSCTVYEGHFSV